MNHTVARVVAKNPRWRVVLVAQLDLAKALRAGWRVDKVRIERETSMVVVVAAPTWRQAGLETPPEEPNP